MSEVLGTIGAWLRRLQPLCEQVIAVGDGSLGTDVRLAAAVNFKNLIKYRWVSAVQQWQLQQIISTAQKLLMARRCRQNWLRNRAHSLSRMQKR